jgi:hypothetical protein
MELQQPLIIPLFYGQLLKRVKKTRKAILNVPKFSLLFCPHITETHRSYVSVTISLLCLPFLVTTIISILVVAFAFVVCHVEISLEIGLVGIGCCLPRQQKQIDDTNK